MSIELSAAALRVARTLPIRGHLAREALGRAVGACSLMEDFERDLCASGVHSDSIFHPSDCPNRTDNSEGES